MCISLIGFLVVGHDLVMYAASSALPGVTYGFAYPLIQAWAADGGPPGLRHSTLSQAAAFAVVWSACGWPPCAGACTTQCPPMRAASSHPVARLVKTLRRLPPTTSQAPTSRRDLTSCQPGNGR